MSRLEQPPASFRVEHVEAKGAEVWEGLIGRPTGFGQGPKTTRWQLFLHNWAMEGWLGGEPGGKGEKGVHIQIVGFLCHHSGHHLST